MRAAQQVPDRCRGGPRCWSPGEAPPASPEPPPSRPPYRVCGSAASGPRASRPSRQWQHDKSSEHAQEQDYTEGVPPLHPATFARCSLRCAPLAASRGKISGALFPRVFLSQAGPPRRGHTRAMAAYHSGPHNLRKKTPGKTPLLPRGAAYGHRLRAGGRAVGAHRPTQPGSAGNRTSAQACAARSALPAPPP